MRESRVRSTQVVGEAIRRATRPPRLWLQSSTATIYAHRFDAPNDERGLLGGDEPNMPPKWKASVEIAKAWEAALAAAITPETRKIALRSAMTMSPETGSIFDVLRSLAKKGLLGPAGNGRQYVSWIHGEDFCRALFFLCEHEDLHGSINLCSPEPLPNAEFCRILRQAVGARFGFPVSGLLLELGAALRGTETELLLKSRRVVPTRLLEAGFEFRYPHWEDAARDLAERSKTDGVH